MQRQKLFLPNGAWPLVLWIVFAVFYAAYFYSEREASIEHYQYVISRIPSVVLYGSGTAKTLEQYAVSYGGFLGIALGGISFLFSYIMLGIASIVRLTSRKFGAMLTFLIATIPLTSIAYTIHSEPAGRTAISAIVFDFVRDPLWYSSLFITGVIILLLILSFVYGNASNQSKTNV